MVTRGSPKPLLRVRILQPLSYGIPCRHGLRGIFLLCGIQTVGHPDACADCDSGGDGGRQGRVAIAAGLRYAFHCRSKSCSVLYRSGIPAPVLPALSDGYGNRITNSCPRSIRSDILQLNHSIFQASFINPQRLNENPRSFPKTRTRSFPQNLVHLSMM